jgi:hypothetical protein
MTTLEKILSYLKKRVLKASDLSKDTTLKPQENTIQEVANSDVYTENGNVIEGDLVQRQIHAQTYIENQYITQVIQDIEKETKRCLATYPAQGSFEGREKELNELHQLLSNNTHLHILSVKGIGGIGKSALAREYFSRKCLDFDFFIFLEGKSDIFSTLNNQALLSNLHLAEQVKAIPFEDIQRADKILALIESALLNLQAKEKGAQTKRLLAIDNIPTDDANIKILNKLVH